MKTIVLLLIGVAALFATAGCEEEHQHHHGHNYGGAYDGTYRSYGHEQYPGYPANGGYWDRSGDWHPH
jgi:hypothetical protein